MGRVTPFSDCGYTEVAGNVVPEYLSFPRSNLYDSQKIAVVPSNNHRILLPVEANEKKTDLQTESKADAYEVKKFFDSYIQKKKVATLVFKNRFQFFEKHIRIRRLLLRIPLNPLLKEGDVLKREGELFLTYEALAMLIYLKIIKKSKRDPRYHTQNVFCINQAEKFDRLVKIIDRLTLNPGDDAKFALIWGRDGIHAATCYIRNVKGKIFGLYLDSTAGQNKEFINALKKKFPGIRCYHNQEKLQSDYYGCATFAFKNIQYFCKLNEKAADELFANFDENDELEMNEAGIKLVPHISLPAPLLKLIQENENYRISEEQYATKVNRTQILAQYKEQFSVLSHFEHEVEKIFDSATLAKNYRYIDELEKLLSDLGIQFHDIPENIADPLPKPLLEIIELMRGDAFLAQEAETELISHTPS